MMIYAIAGLAFFAIAGLGLAFTGGQSETVKKRTKAVASGAGTAVGRNARKTQDESAMRRKKTQEMLEKLRDDGKQKRSSITPRDIGSKLTQAGLDIPVSMFWIFSLILGVGFAAVVFMSGAQTIPLGPLKAMNIRPALIGGAFFGGAFGFPRFLLGILIKMRHKKMTDQFADALDIIVRGVKSGLPLNECLRIIAKESPDPLGSEFGTLSDSLAMGTTIDRALANFYQRCPLAEVNFFTIVLNIQSKAGGNLSEALGNLSGVIRSRKMMREKIKAMSSEAKASGGIIAILPFAVGFMVYLTTPDYIMQLFVTETGHMILTLAAILLFMGTMVMRNMMNFEI